jgi:hypothetical protein
MFEKLQVQTVPELVRLASMLQLAERRDTSETAAWPWFGSFAGPPQTRGAP